MKRPKHKQNIKSTTLPLKPNHTWKSPAGYKIIALDRGLVSFNVPEGWHLAKLEPFELNDAAPPDDNARLTVSFWRLPPGVDWTGLPLDQLMEDSTKGDKLKILSKSELARETRPDAELVWVEHRFQDTEQDNREAYTRILIARGWNVHVLITFDFWVDEAEKFVPEWDEIFRSLQLGRQIADPTAGGIEH